MAKAAPSATCSCSPIDLLIRSIDLIEPPRSSSSVGGDEKPDGKKCSADQADGNIAPPAASKKGVRFDPSCLPPKKRISVDDAARSYEMLVHAASIASTSPLSSSESDGLGTIDAYTGWDELNIAADIYRALLVASCLLLELASPDPSSDADDWPIRTDTERSITSNDASTCPLQCTGDSDEPMSTSFFTSTEEDILSTARRCILRLQSLERICAAKAIAQSHRSDPMHLASFYEGGDEIHDYERPIPDLHANYDWHDDGFLPTPFAHIITTADDNGDVTFQRTKFLSECCYRPEYPNDPPSSRYEKSAWTRDLIRGDRVVSLRLMDYQDECDQQGINATELACMGNREMNTTRNDTTDNGTEHFSNEGNDEPSAHGVSLDISPSELAKEEDYLIDIMLASEASMGTASASASKRPGITKTKRKKKKRNKTKKKEEQNTADDNRSQGGQSVQAKEGFLLVCNGIKCSTHTFLGAHDEASVHDGHGESGVRVFVTLHPSGRLSIEDRSIRSWPFNDIIETEPLSPRPRYFDFLVDTKTRCQACVPSTASSGFQFQVSCIQFLGCSTIGNDCKPNGVATFTERVDLFFSVDEGSGGDFIDGFEWVNALSAFTDKLLIEDF